MIPAVPVDLRTRNAGGCAGTHRMSNTPTYRSWRAMRTRVFNPRTPGFKIYGKLTIHPRWVESFEAFLEDVGPRPKGMTLDRIDTRKGYVPGNVRWATLKQQQRNCTNRRKFTFRGKTLMLVEWEEIVKIPWRILGDRLRRGWTIERALTSPPDPHAKCDPKIKADRMARAKLTRGTVRKIRSEYAHGGVSHADLGRRYGVARETIAAVLQRRTWRDVR